MLFISLVSITACGSKKNNKEENKKEIATPLLYEVTKEGSNNKIYILGTIHVGELSNIEFADYVKKSFADSHYVAAEVDNEDNENDIFEEFNKMMYQDDDNIKNHLTEEQYSKLMKFIDDNDLDMGFFEKDKMNLNYYSSLIIQFISEKSGLNMEEGIDNYFVNRAKKEGKIFMEIESSDFQDSLLLNLSDAYYVNSIISAIDNIDEEIEGVKQMFESWKKGDEEELWKDDGSIFKEEDRSKYSEEDIKAAQEFDEKVLYSRNLTMTDKLEEFFNNNYDTFFMVGQDHVVGNKGIVSHLRQRGYKVEKLK